ncbi:MAG TPA: rhodanese-like domain-containing protein [Alphaproteobacteria bacterium]|nr:rhodanese-like domain-containing protein [Alphaproteobacteria bacterium]
MQSASIQDGQKAKEYFEHKVAFTTGPVELGQMIQSGKVNVVDVREAEDYEKGHIPGAVNIPPGTWENPQGLIRDKINVVYCYTQQCHLAAKACAGFAAKWFPVMELEGGFEVWKEYEMDIETGPAKQEPMRKAA